MTSPLLRYRLDAERLEAERELGRRIIEHGATLPQRPIGEPSPRNLRYLLLCFLRERDGNDCYLCRKPLDLGHIAVEHIIPIAQGGENEPWNIALACSTCNNRKGTQIVSMDTTTRAPIYR